MVPHEAYPGHHLQFTIANQRGSLLRNVPWTFANAAAVGVDTIEGWAHYSRAMMKERGFHNELADQFQFVSDALWRAARVLIDIGLATGRMSLDEAMTLLADDVGMPPAVRAVKCAVTRSCPVTTSATPSGEISDRRAAHERLTPSASAWGNDFSLSRFHELVMTNGVAPLSLVRERMAGAELRPFPRDVQAEPFLPKRMWSVRRLVRMVTLSSK